MNAQVSLQENFSSMHDEFSSSNNRMKRAIDEIFASEFKDLEDSLDYFNCEYLVVDKRKLTVIINEFKQKMMNDKYILAFWVSPSGNGYKGLIRVNYINIPENL